MTNNPLSVDFVKNLLRKEDAKLPGARAIFTDDELKSIKMMVRDERTKVFMRGKWFNIRYFTWRKEDWITIRPVKGFVPMFSWPKKRFLNDPELEI